MQQTFYIDNDEEISSVIDRLKKSLAKENYIVVPRRALFLQSIVNLKLLKREAEKLRKKVVLVTQDELGMNMAEKAGVEARVSLDGVEHEESESDATDDAEDVSADDDVTIKSHPSHSNKQVRLKEVGSNDFFSDNRPTPRIARVEVTEEPAVRIAPTPQPAPLAPPMPRVTPKTQPKVQPLSQQQPRTSQSLYRGPLDPNKERTIEKMFQDPTPAAPTQDPTLQEKVPVGNRTKKIFLGFVLLCVVVFSGAGLYVYLPKALITVTLAQQEKKIDADIKGSVNQQTVEVAATTIPVRFLEAQETFTAQYDATGQGEGSGGQKAKGTVVIQNKFSAQSQQLIATTRLEAANGKIFRITKSVVVPGMTTVGSEEKAGAIEVEVVADQPGDAYNIQPTTFTIPGFKDGPKYEKFGATSAKPMTGGSTSGDTIMALSQKDIDGAKKDVSAKLTEKLTDAIKQQMASNEVFLDDAVRTVITDNKSTLKAGEVRNVFDWGASGSMSVLVFSKKDVEAIILAQYEKNRGSGGPLAASVRSDYAGVTPDFDKKELSMRVHSVVTQSNQIVADDLKKEFLGKNEQQIEALIKKYPTIKNVKFEFQPGFINRVPQYAQRVELSIVTEEK